MCEARIGQLLLHCACNGGFRFLSTTLTSQLLKNGSKIFMKGIEFIKITSVKLKACFVDQNPPHLCPAKNTDHTVYIYVSKDQKLFNKKLIRSIHILKITDIIIKKWLSEVNKPYYCVTYLRKQEIAQYKSWNSVTKNEDVIHWLKRYPDILQWVDKQFHA